jgi:16S rRNA A1518/A1519 N6-dimethyltransferase RsmA/KsgA/DIM1 with predicted DNA glycosylase/AP lyase activity
MRNALRRLGLSPTVADSALIQAEVDPDARPETLDLEAFARLTSAVST